MSLMMQVVGEKLLPLMPVPADRLVVTESGILAPADVREARRKIEMATTKRKFQRINQ